VNTAGRLRRAIVTAVAAVLASLSLGACKVDLETNITVTDNGSGSLVVTATADADALRLAPELRESLNLDDLRDAGWNIDVRNPNVDGGLTVVADRDFANVDEATFFLSQLSGEGGPLRGMSLVRTGGTNDATYTFFARGGLPNGMAGFADAEALAVLGGNPFQEAIERSGRSIGDMLSVAVRLKMPGDVTLASSAALPRTEDEPFSSFEWNVPVDGSEILLDVTTRDRDLSAIVLTVVAQVLLVILIILVAGAVLYVATVVQRRNRSTPAS